MKRTCQHWLVALGIDVEGRRDVGHQQRFDRQRKPSRCIKRTGRVSPPEGTMQISVAPPHPIHSRTPSPPPHGPAPLATSRDHSRASTILHVSTGSARAEPPSVSTPTHPQVQRRPRLPPSLSPVPSPLIATGYGYCRLDEPAQTANDACPRMFTGLGKTKLQFHTVHSTTTKKLLIFSPEELESISA